MGQRKNENDKILQLKENKNAVDQNLWHSVKAVLTGKFVAVNTYI